MGETSAKNAWVQDKMAGYISPETWAMMPDDVRDAVLIAANGLYNWGFQHGRSFAGCAQEPTYHVEPRIVEQEHSLSVA